jgi:hypothetical protein
MNAFVGALRGMDKAGALEARTSREPKMGKSK